MENNKPYYLNKNKKYDRVTAVLAIINDPVYDSFKRTCSPNEREEMIKNAGSIGTQFHEITNQIENNVINDINHPIVSMLKFEDNNLHKMTTRYLDWFKQTIDKVIDVEKRVFNKAYKYGGTIDLVATLKGSKEKILIEKKTSVIKSKSYELQKIAYLHSDYCRINKINKCLTVIVDRKGKLHKTFYTKKNGALFMHFVSILSIYKYFNK